MGHLFYQHALQTLFWQARGNKPSPPYVGASGKEFFTFFSLFVI
jgi:hypothetical protein